MKRSERKGMAEETVEIVQRGHYTTSSGRIVNIKPDVDAAKASTKIYDGSPPEFNAQRFSTGAAVEVTNESTFVAMRRLHAEAAGQVGCLNFASAKNPGGGFLNGSEAQEEALSRASALYECLLCAREYYERNRAHPSCLYLNLAIASRAVPFIRNDGGELLDEPLLATVITSPAPNAGAVATNEPDRVREIELTMRHRAEMVLRIAALEGIDALVLGAWGCGVFRNDPGHVARTFAELLNPGQRYSKSFRRVVFAVFDPEGAGPNFCAFKEEFA